MEKKMNNLIKNEIKATPSLPEGSVAGVAPAERRGLGQSPIQIETQLRLTNGVRKVSFRYDLLNKNDIKIGELDGITRAHISYGEFRPIKRSATFEINEHQQQEINYLSDQIQPWFVLHMPCGNTAQWPLGIFLLESPTKQTTGNVSTRHIGAYDKTIIVEQDKFLNSFFIEKGTNYVTAVTRILNTAGITKINITQTSHSLPSDREYRLGTKKHLTINELLREINYTTLWFDEFGVARSEPYITPARREITQIYDTTKNSIITPTFTEHLNIADRPNVFIRVALNLENNQELTSTFINDDITSPISTVNRGRQIPNYETIDNITNQEMLDAFVRRVAVESTSAYTHLTFGTALMPTQPSTLLCIFPEIFSTPQKFHLTGWEMPLVYDGIMTHHARKVVRF